MEKSKSALPQTDEQALMMLQYSDNNLMIALQGIYLCYRALDKSVIEAYILALEAHAGKSHD